jgi:hypothetical protein
VTRWVGGPPSSQAGTASVIGRSARSPGPSGTKIRAVSPGTSRPTASASTRSTDRLAGIEKVTGIDTSGAGAVTRGSVGY